MKKIAISVPGAPTPTGPFNHAVRYGDLVFTSGQAGRNRETGKMGDIADQARRCLANLQAVLETAGTSLEHTLKVTVFMRKPGRPRRIQYGIRRSDAENRIPRARRHFAI